MPSNDDACQQKTGCELEPCNRNQVFLKRTPRILQSSLSALWLATMGTHLPWQVSVQWETVFS